MRGNVSDIQDIKRMLKGSGKLTSHNEDLIDNAIYALKNDNEYRAESSLRTLAANLRNEGNDEEAGMVERLL